MPNAENYDPVKAHEYYMRTRHRRRQPRAATKANEARRPAASTRSTSNTPSKSKTPKQSPMDAARARVERLDAKVATLERALSAANAAMSKARQNERKKARESSDGKSSEKEKQASQKYRDKHKEELKSKAKKESSSSSSTSSSSSGGSSSSSPSSRSLSDMSSEELGSRIIRIKRALQDARTQLSKARQQFGSIAHSAITSDPHVNEHFAQFRSEKGFRQNDSST